LPASRHLRTGSLAAILAVLLNALWPLLAHARPADSLAIPVCTVGGETHYIEIERGDSPLEQRSKAQHDHCKLCVFGAERAIALPSGAPVLSLRGASQAAVPPPPAPPASFAFISTARSRAPPAFS
jgi:hypothetical protein